MNKKQELEQKILQASKAYYNGEAIITDNQYDALVQKLVELDPDNYILKNIGAEPTTTEWEKEKHLFPLGSLNKKNYPEEIDKWIKETLKNKDIVVSDKLDGLSIGCQYENGKLIKAILRGGGIEGENILANVLKMQGVVREIPHFTGVLRGEIILTKSNYKKYFSNKANPRNAASGICRRLDGKGCEYLTIMFYEILCDYLDVLEIYTEMDQYSFLQKNGCMVPRYKFCKSSKEIIELWNKYQNNIRASLDYEIDGLVISCNDLKFQKQLGIISMRPKGKMAFKFIAIMKETIIKNIKIYVGNSGRVTPVAIIEPTHLMGATIERASLHNFSNIEKLGVDIGAKVLLKRANDVIPYVEAVTKTTGTTFKAPTHCPICGKKVEFEGEFLMCLNNACPAKVKGKIKNWIKALNILEWGDALVVGLLESGKLRTIDDLYKLTEDDLSSLPRMGEKSAKKALKKIHEGKNITLEQFVGGLSIPMIGETITGLLIDAGYDTIDKIRKCFVRDFIDVPGIGTEKAYSLHRGLLENEKLIDSLLECVDIKSRVGNLVGKTFAFTGKTENKRAVLEKMVADNGGSVKSVSAGLSYLVIADPNSSSSKAIKARKLGIKLISEDDFLKMVI